MTTTALATTTETSIHPILPRNMAELEDYGSVIAKSGLGPPQWRNPQAAMLMVATAMELGLSPMQAMRGLFSVDGKVGMGADLMVALCRRSPSCEYFRLVESTPEKATWESKRKGLPPVKMSFTLEDARTAGLTGKGPWKSFPAAMLRARAASALARAEYQEALFGMYTPEELSGGAVPDIMVVESVSPPAVSAEPPDAEWDQDTGEVVDWVARVKQTESLEEIDAVGQEARKAIPKGDPRWTAVAAAGKMQRATLAALAELAQTETREPGEEG